MVKKIYIRLAAIVLLAGLALALPSVALATSVDRMALCDLEGHPGETVEAQITLQGTDGEERSGYWETYYKPVEGDDASMDITSWVTIEPAEYAIKQGESQTFTVRVKIPAGAAPGLWGATSAEAGQAGHSAERRTYLIFKDTITGGNVYSGLLIPISVDVLGKANPSASVIGWVKANVMVSILILVVIVLLSVMLRKRRLARASA
jgi:hypothetical protein